MIFQTQSADDSRVARLSSWLHVVFGHADFQLDAASDDASFRRYFRVTLGKGRSLIAMDAPPAQEDSRPFVRIALDWGRGGLPVPAIFAIDLAAGFLLLEDFGGQDLLATNADGFEQAAYDQALDGLIKLQQRAAGGFVPYNQDLVQRELDLFPEWYVKRHLGAPWGNTEDQAWQALSEAIHSRWSAMDQSIVHRDFHSRNLMLRTEGRVGWLDFQDACYGPAVYDVVSLLKDCYIELPAATRIALWQRWHSAASQAGVVTKGEAAAREDFEWAGIQRHLKVLGIFCRLNYRDNKSRYLADLPLVKKYLLDAMQPFSVCEPIRALVAGSEAA